MPDSAIYTIDGQDVNDRVDWRHLPPTTSLTAQRFEGFPGWGGMYPIIGVPTGVRLVVTGWLQAPGFAGLHAEVLAAEAMRNNASQHTVAIHGVSYEIMLLEGFRAVGAHVAFARPSGDTWVRIAVEYLWRQLVPTEGGGA